MKVVAVLLMGGVVLGACGGAGRGASDLAPVTTVTSTVASPSSTTTVGPSAAPSATVSSTPAPVVAAPPDLKQKYQTLATNANKQLTADTTKVEQDAQAQDLAKVKADFSSMATDSHNIGSQFEALTFPSSMRNDVNAWAAAINAVQQACQAGANLQSFNGYPDVHQQLANAATSLRNANAAVSKDLGITT